MTYYSSKNRSHETEIMDSFDLNGTEMRALLTDLKNVNKWLGGNKVTLNGILELTKKLDVNSTITILDVGCGDGEMLRQCAHFGKKKGLNLKLIGIDANEYILEEARKRSRQFENISFKNVNIFSDKNIPSHDITLFTLFLHHFKNKEIVTLLNNFAEISRIGLVINDLERSRLAFCLFYLVRNLLKTKTAKNDGLVSVARGFTKKELLSISEKIEKVNATINWKWAFRFQLIFRKTHPKS